MIVYIILFLYFDTIQTRHTTFRVNNFLHEICRLILIMGLTRLIKLSKLGLINLVLYCFDATRI
jgi:hypothetical protein